MNDPKTSRRQALQVIASVAASAPAFVQAKPAQPPRQALGLDAHAVRGMKWKSLQLIDYAAKLNLDGVLLNGPHYFESLETEHLRRVKAAADAKGLKIYIGAGGISEGAKSYKNTHGSGAGILREGIRIAKAVGSPVVNCRIGNIDDRYTEGRIEARLSEAARSLKAVRGEARDAGLKFAFENHAGDTRSEEILGLIDEVGSDTLGVMLDPGNAVWALEDPMEQLEKLGRHVICTSVRDYTVWVSEDGAMFQWTAIGDGLMDVPAYLQTFKKLCPGVPFFVETISNQARPIPFLNEEFMSGFPDLKVTDITAFLKLCRKGSPPPILKAPEGTNAKAFDQQLQKAEFENSIATLRRHT
jgi:sugar phosphate isomerase/epimerase